MFPQELKKAKSTISKPRHALSLLAPCANDAIALQFFIIENASSNTLLAIRALTVMLYVPSRTFSAHINRPLRNLKKPYPYYQTIFVIIGRTFFHEVKTSTSDLALNQVLL